MSSVSEQRPDIVGGGTASKVERMFGVEKIVEVRVILERCSLFFLVGLLFCSFGIAVPDTCEAVTDADQPGGGSYPPLFCFQVVLHNLSRLGRLWEVATSQLSRYHPTPPTHCSLDFQGVCCCRNAHSPPTIAWSRSVALHPRATVRQKGMSCTTQLIIAAFKHRAAQRYSFSFCLPFPPSHSRMCCPTWDCPSRPLSSWLWARGFLQISFRCPITLASTTPDDVLWLCEQEKRVSSNRRSKRGPAA